MMTNTKIISIGLIAIMVLLLLPAISFSALEFTTLEPITNGIKLPQDVAVSPDGKVYVVDGLRGQILIYDRKGQSAGNIPIAKPTSVAVGSNGNIYIGTNSDMSVKILDPSHNIVGSLGIGAGEFKLPRNITIDMATGNVYVVDQLDNSIKVYTPNGIFLSKIDDYPNLPQDATIMGNEIYVIDSPLITDYQGGTIRGAEVQVFDMAGSQTRYFGSYGAQEGQFIRPSGITSGTDGILYISDSFHGVVLCFDSSGSYLGAIQNASKPMVTPMGIALGGDKRLFVASLNTASVHIFGLKGYTTMDVSPSELSFTAQQGQSNPSEQTLTITNSGTGTLNYTATSTDSWIVLNAPPTGTVGPSGSETISVGVTISALSAGAYAGKITITDDSGASEVIKVNLEVTAPPVLPTLTVTPQTLNYTYRIGDPEPASQAVNIEISNGAATWTATPDSSCSSWLSIDPSTMSSNSYTQAEVKVDPTDLAPGVHTGNITITAPGAVGSPANVEVTLTVTSSGTINVSCNITDASFTIAGPKNYDGSGQTWTATEVPDGQYTITYDAIVGYKTPQSETKGLSVREGSTIEFEGNYVSLAMSANIIVSRGSDYKTPSTIGIFDTNGTMLFSFAPFSEGVSSSAKPKGKNTGSSYGANRYDTQEGVNTAVGDIDGDGEADIVAGLSPGRKNPAEIAIYRANGNLIEGSDFIALSTMYGANVAVADFDGDGKAEIVVGAGLSSGNPAQVKVFKYESGTIIDTGIDFNAFSVKGGVNIATGDVDVDGDGIPELMLITAAGTNYSASPEIKIWKINTSGSIWSVSIVADFVAFSGRYGASVTTGDLNGDSIDEIIVGSGPDPKGGPNIIKAFNGDGTDFRLEITDSSKGYGLNVASADLDSDGIAEIIAGLGPSSKNPATVKIYKANGILVKTFTAYDGARYGAVVSTGDLGY
jgi:hypothetical protein